MKKMLKLAAVAVSLALVAGLAACSSGDDDVVDATTPKYLLTAQIDKYFASIKYDQNVPDADIKKLEDANKEVMKVLGGCADCLDVYLKLLKQNVWDSESKDLSDSDIEDVLGEDGLFVKLKTSYKTENAFHASYVYRSAIATAADALAKAKEKVSKITSAGFSDKGELSNEQAANMNAYIDAAKALQKALSEEDAKKCEAKIKAANDAIVAYGEVTKFTDTSEITKVTTAVTAMANEVKSKVYDKLQEPVLSYEDMTKWSNEDND